MSDEVLRVEFRVEMAKRAPAPRPEPGAERQRRDRVARRARNLALAHWIDHLIQTGTVNDLAEAAQMCRVSRARLTTISEGLSNSLPLQEEILAAAFKADQ